jgi:manganese transport protein
MAPPPATTIASSFIPPHTPLPPKAGWWRRLFAFAGPGYLVAVGYMDPGNWATDLAGGSRFGYQLLCIIVLSNLMAMLLQALAAKLGIVTGLDLAQACRQRYARPTRLMLWLLCEVAIIACELAEVIGTAVALKLLFGLPLPFGVLLTGVNVMIVTILERYGYRRLEMFVVALMLVVALCLGAEVIMARPDLGGIAAGLLPGPQILADPAKLYIAVGILGATVMPHNLYLHSAQVKERVAETDESKRDAVRFASIDSAIALTLAMFVNAAILIIAAATFHAHGQTHVTEIDEAYRLLTPMLGSAMASILFGLALLASGQNSAVTGAIAGQIVMEGFTDIRMPVWARRLLLRLLAIVPAAFVAVSAGESGVAKLLILSQVVLSLQLPFAIVPLIRMTADRRLMGPFATRGWMLGGSLVAATLIIALNGWLLTQFVFQPGALQL